MSTQPRRTANLGTYQSPRKRAPQKRKQKKRPFVRFVCVLLILCVLCSIGLYRYIFAGYEAEKTEFSAEELGIDPQNVNKKLLHVAVFGIDSYESKVGRSDCTMMLTVDLKNHQLKITSFLRDSYLPVKGHGNDKLTHAFAYGGAPLALHTLNSNFDLDVADYIVLSYKDVANMVDTLDGLDLEITESERKELNRIAAEMESDAELVTDTGLVHLNGLQVTAYARIRKIDTENMRTQRQRIVLQAILEKCKAAGVLKYPALLHNFLPYIQTNISKTRMLRLAFGALGCKKVLHEYVVPSDDDDPIGGLYAGFWCWRYDIDAASDRLHTFLDSKVEPKDPS